MFIWNLKILRILKKLLIKDNFFVSVQDYLKAKYVYKK